MLLRRYGNIDYVLKLQFCDAIELINFAAEEEQKEKFFRIWLERYSSYTKKDYESFEEFYEKCFPPVAPLDTRSMDELMQEIMEAEQLIKKKGEHNGTF